MSTTQNAAPQVRPDDPTPMIDYWLYANLDGDELQRYDLIPEEFTELKRHLRELRQPKTPAPPSEPPVPAERTPGVDEIIKAMSPKEYDITKTPDEHPSGEYEYMLDMYQLNVIGADGNNGQVILDGHRQVSVVTRDEYIFLKRALVDVRGLEKGGNHQRIAVKDARRMLIECEPVYAQIAAATLEAITEGDGWCTPVETFIHDIASGYATADLDLKRIIDAIEELASNLETLRSVHHKTIARNPWMVSLWENSAEEVAQVAEAAKELLTIGGIDPDDVFTEEQAAMVRKLHGMLPQEESPRDPGDQPAKTEPESGMRPLPANPTYKPSEEGMLADLRQIINNAVAKAPTPKPSKPFTLDPGAPRITSELLALIIKMFGLRDEEDKSQEATTPEEAALIRQLYSMLPPDPPTDTHAKEAA